ncbi:protein 82 [Theileria equi strain WA]|uniref:Protein 82 n=1 Tax=Theileria equi strain WA TaxID=1537102 RepID=L0B301_THEEQ|nr:protein 82 [Theileria equi strain WA]AFZ81479.1 protein 82 [Theileria equi strain WA]|eukprot:XP_004831145.1 protein 82 [Theileria equi strain WA]
MAVFIVVPFVVLSTALVRAYSGYLLDVHAPVDTSNISAQSFELDDIHYVCFLPKNGIRLDDIVASESIVWRGGNNEKCTSALFAYSNDMPELAHLFIKSGNTTVAAYYKHGEKGWSFIDRSEYSSLLKLLKSSVKAEVLTLDISENADTNKYTVEKSLNKPQTMMFSPKVGYHVTSIVDGDEPVWKAEAKGDRSVFVWFYTSSGRKIMVRNLVTYANGFSEIRVYIYISGKWVYSKNLTSHIRDRAVSHKKSLRHEKNNFTTPEDFFHPEDVPSPHGDITTPEDFFHPEDVASLHSGITTPKDFIHPEDVASLHSGITTPKDFIHPEDVPSPHGDITTPEDFFHPEDVASLHSGITTPEDFFHPEDVPSPHGDITTPEDFFHPEDVPSPHGDITTPEDFFHPEDVASLHSGITTPKDFFHPEDVASLHSGITTPKDFIHPEDVPSPHGDITTPEDFFHPEDVASLHSGITTPEDFFHPEDVPSPHGDITTPEDFFHPEDVPSPHGDITTPEDFFHPEDVASLHSGITTPEDFEDVRPDPLPFDKFVSMDFTSTVDASKCATIKSKTKGIDVTFYYSRGFYFDNVSKDGLTIWKSHSSFEGATSVSFYCKGELQLADVLVANPKNGDKFQYYVKTETMWKPLEKHTFLSMLNDGYKLEQDSAIVPLVSALTLVIACTLTWV